MYMNGRKKMKRFITFGIIVFIGAVPLKMKWEKYFMGSDLPPG